jgi:hypothetical protein
VKVSPSQFEYLISAPEYAPYLFFRANEGGKTYLNWNTIPKSNFIETHCDSLKGLFWCMAFNDHRHEVDHNGFLLIERNTKAGENE